MPESWRTSSPCGATGAHTTRIACGPHSGLRNSLVASKEKMYSSPVRENVASPLRSGVIRPIAVSEVMMRVRMPDSSVIEFATAATSAYVDVPIP